jgi:hypothetical protein
LDIAAKFIVEAASVHGCIALADAVLVAASGERVTDDDHAEVGRPLRTWCAAKKIADGGIKHFDWLVRKKDALLVRRQVR